MSRINSQPVLVIYYRAGIDRGSDWVSLVALQTNRREWCLLNMFLLPDDHLKWLKACLDTSRPNHV